MFRAANASAQKRLTWSAMLITRLDMVFLLRKHAVSKALAPVVKPRQNQRALLMSVRRVRRTMPRPRCAGKHLAGRTLLR
jgi:hypothetical protein